MKSESEYNCYTNNKSELALYRKCSFRTWCQQIKNQWDKPVFVTENGVADKSDRYRAPFIVAHLQEIKRAITDGADVIGYLHWSFMDNYEWQEAYRPESKFGLFRIDRKTLDGHPDFDRQITKGAEAFKLIIEKSTTRGEGENGVVLDFALSEAKERFGSFTSDGLKIVQQKTTDL